MGVPAGYERLKALVPLMPPPDVQKKWVGDSGRGLMAGVTFDLAFSFSVFTHIPERVARAVLLALRQRIAKNGVFIITIRSYEFWGLRQSSWPDETVRKLQRDHETDGYAFQTFNSSGMNANYGDTTMSFDFIEKMASECGLRVSGIDRDMSEPFQIVVALQPA